MSANADPRLLVATVSVTETTTAPRVLDETMSCRTTVTSAVVVLNAEALRRSFPTAMTDRLLDRAVAGPKAKTTTTEGTPETPRYVKITIYLQYKLS